jgi:hypothetical protein
MKYNVHDEVPNGILKILILFYGMLNWGGVLNWDGVSKSSNGIKGTMLHIFKVRFITWSSILKYSYVDDTIEGMFMM